MPSNNLTLNTIERNFFRIDLILTSVSKTLINSKTSENKTNRKRNHLLENYKKQIIKALPDFRQN